jgi:hypothetical protein
MRRKDRILRQVEQYYYKVDELALWYYFCNIETEHLLIQAHTTVAYIENYCGLIERYLGHIAELSYCLRNCNWPIYEVEHRVPEELLYESERLKRKWKRRYYYTYVFFRNQIEMKSLGIRSQKRKRETEETQTPATN